MFGKIKRGLVEKILNVYPNAHGADAIVLSKELFNQAKHSIKIVAGELDAQFYEHPEIIKELEKAIERGVKVEVITGPSLDLKTVQIPKWAEQGKLHLYKLRERPELHFIVVDGEHARLEEFHTTKQRERRAYTLKKTFFLARKLEMEFTKLKAKFESQDKASRRNG